MGCGGIWLLVGTLSACAGEPQLAVTLAEHEKLSGDAGALEDASGEASLPGLGSYCSRTLGPVPVSMAAMGQAFWCPGVCSSGPGFLPVPQLPGSDSAAPSYALFSCVVENGTVLMAGGDW